MNKKIIEHLMNGNWHTWYVKNKNHCNRVCSCGADIETAQYLIPTGVSIVGLNNGFIKISQRLIYHRVQQAKV